MKKILMIVGSLRKNSFNLRLAAEIESIVGERASFSYLNISALPYMNQDLEFPPPESVSRARSAVLEADGIWICSPEYNHSIPGVLKNALDWLSRPMNADRKGGSAIRGKPVTFSCAAGRSGAGYVRPALRDFAEATSMRLVCGEGTGVSLDAEAYRSDILSLSGEIRAQLAAQAEEFLAALSTATRDGGSKKL